MGLCWGSYLRPVWKQPKPICEETDLRLMGCENYLRSVKKQTVG